MGEPSGSPIISIKPIGGLFDALAGLPVTNEIVIAFDAITQVSADSLNANQTFFTYLAISGTFIVWIADSSYRVATEAVETNGLAVCAQVFDALSEIADESFVTGEVYYFASIDAFTFNAGKPFITDDHFINAFAMRA